MARWITFDPTTARELRSRVPMEGVFEAPGRSALEYALSSSGNVVAVLDAGLTDQRALAVFRRTPALKGAPNPARRLRAGGILGLADETVFEEEARPPAKSWWRRLWEDEE